MKTMYEMTKAMAATFQNGNRTEAETMKMARDYINRQLGTIEIHCDGCKAIHTVQRTLDIHPRAKRLGCNWCPKCEENATDYYQEWTVFSGPRRNREREILNRRFPKQEQINFDHGKEIH
jgi:hypothetical protein